MATGSKAREILNYSFLVALADDCCFDDSELSYIKNLALADGVVDDSEKQALRRVFALVDESRLSPTARIAFNKFRGEHKV